MLKLGRFGKDKLKIPGKFWNVVLEKDGEDQLDRLCEKKNRKCYIVKKEMRIVHTIKRGKATWIGHILHRNCLTKRIIEEKTEEGIQLTERQGRRRKQLLDGLKEIRGYRKLKEEVLIALCGELAFEVVMGLS